MTEAARRPLRHQSGTGRRRTMMIVVALAAFSVSSCAKPLGDEQHARLATAPRSTSVSALRKGAEFGQLVTTARTSDDVRVIAHAIRRANGSWVLLEDLLGYLDQHPKATVIEPLRTSVARLAAPDISRLQTARLANVAATSHGKSWDRLLHELGEERSAAELVARSLSVESLTELRAAAQRFASDRSSATAVDGLDGRLYALSNATARTLAPLRQGGSLGNSTSAAIDLEKLRTSAPIDPRTVPTMPSASMLRHVSWHCARTRQGSASSTTRSLVTLPRRSSAGGTRAGSLDRTEDQARLVAEHP